jgi:hypothetical protein
MRSFLAPIRSRRAVVLGCILALAAAASTGCWRSSAPQAKQQLDKQKQQKPKPPFEPLRVFTEPNDRSSFDPKKQESERIVTALKPGHWTGVLVQAKANLFDFNGQLETTAQDSRRRRIDLEHAPFRLASTRAAVLPKGQQKTLATLFFAPRPADAAPTKGSTWIGNSLDDAAGGQREYTDLVPHMPSYQYYLVVLARESGRYRYLKVLNSVRPPTDFLGTNVEDTSYFRVVFPDVGAPLALAADPLCWTNVAAVLWDDVLPAALTPEQQQALVDWLHWGGTVIVSGPDSLDKLPGSFLAPYLPATAAAAGPLDPTALAELHAHWTVAGDNSPPPGTRPGAQFSGVKLDKHRQAEFLPGTGQLVAERRVGRGRVVITAFRLSEQDLVGWRSFDGFMNACIFRRPPRQFDATRNRLKYLGPAAPEPFAPEIVSSVRILTRDAHAPPGERPDSPAALDDEGAIDPNADLDASWPEVLVQLKAQSGVGGWDDFGWYSSAARQTLQDAAGIAVPKRTFVVEMIGLYLLVVVGVNWLLFRLMGRVEWAWLAVPAISLGWGVLVIWLAQLDIGFARSETEVAVLEVQPDYNRGHLTRYTALYSSLSTTYDLRFSEPSAVALPFAVNQALLSGQSSSEVSFSTVGERVLSGFPVASNSTGMVHSEQMFDLGGRIIWQQSADGPGAIENGTALALSGAAVIRRRVDGQGRAIDESAWLGELSPGETATLRFVPHDSAELARARRADPLSASKPPEGTLSLRRLIECAENHRALAPGEMRLVAWREGELAGVEVRPSARQSRRATLIVAHLQFGAFETPRPDANLSGAAPQEDEFSERP